MKPFLRSALSSHPVYRLGSAFAAAFLVMLMPVAAHAASCQTQCDPAPGSSEGFVTPNQGSETTWTGSVPSPTPTPTPGITGVRAINFTDTGDNVVPDDQTFGWAFTVNS